jgi:iron complex outermembrane receptor protein
MLKPHSFHISMLSIVILGSGSVGTTTSAFAKVQENAQPTERILITGSRIKRTKYESANPIQIITAQEIESRGFNSVYETLQANTAAFGSNQSGSSARNVETINLRGFGPNRTLFLLNGKRVANYPRVYDSNYNVFNISSIPIAVVEKIEIITSASSSVYGSDAVGGVVNIITKKNVDSTTLNINGSSSEHEDARNKRLSLVSGSSTKESNWTMAVEYEQQDMLRGKQRSWLNDRFDTPADIENQSEFRTQLPRALVVYKLKDDWTSLDPGQNVCNQYDELTYTGISFLGNYCGRDNTGDDSYTNEKENASVYFSGEYDLFAQQTLTFDVLYWQSSAIRLNTQSWSSDHLKDEIRLSDNWSGDGQFIVEDGTSYALSRDFQRKELLNGKGQEEHFDESMFNISVSLQGLFFDDYNYEVYLSHSLAKNKQSSYQLKKEAVSDYYVDYNETSGAINVDFDKWWQPLTEEGFSTIFALDKSYSDSSVSTLGASITGEVSEVLKSPIEFAVFSEFESSMYDLNEHPRTLGQEGQGWVGKTGTVGSGKRNRYAIGGELRTPLLDNLTLELSARYDRYIDDTLVSVAPTYKLGIEWRPLEQFLVRATHGTTFRAPDLHNVFKGESGSYDYMSDFSLIDSCNAFNQGNYDDILLGSDNLELLSKTCDEEYDFTGFYSALNQSLGNKNLKAETGHTTTMGFVWSTDNNTAFTFDLYNIKLNNIVVPDSLYTVNLNEYECLSGQRDLSDSTCTSTLNQVDRNDESGFDSFKINTVRTSFINSALRETTGFDMGVTLSFALSNQLQLKLDSTYSHVLETKVQTHSDESVDKYYRDNYYNNDLRSKSNIGLTLEAEQWHLSLTHVRYGSVPNNVDNGDWTQLERKRYAPLNLYNMTMGYQLGMQQILRGGIINLFDSRARNDASEQWYPYFDTSVYPINTVVIGRQVSLGYQLLF